MGDGEGESGGGGEDVGEVRADEEAADDGSGGDSSVDDGAGCVGVATPEGSPVEEDMATGWDVESAPVEDNDTVGEEEESGAELESVIVASVDDETLGEEEEVKEEP